MGKHAKVTAVATTVEPRDLAYWHRMLMAARKDGLALHEEMAYEQIDKLLDAKLAAKT